MFYKMLAAVSLAAATLTMAPVSAAPIGPGPLASDGLVVQVRGCHRDVERHYVPEIGRRAWHMHRGPNCRPVVVHRPGVGPGPAMRDCHRDVRRHFLPEAGRRVLHRHVGPNCAVRVIRRAPTY